MSHSKRNTSRPVFTAHERALAKASWASSSARLARESFLPLAACNLCLEPAADPVACASHGDVFCRECALRNLLAQRQDIRRAGRARERERAEEEAERRRREAEAQERAVREFEWTQAGLDARLVTAAAGGEGERRRDSEVDGSAQRGAKRKFSLDQEEVARIATEERARARRKLDAEQATKPALPSFWTPSVTPTSNAKDTLHEVKKEAKSLPVCPASQEDKPHHYSMQTLVTINFTEEKKPTGGGGQAAQRICPACTKELTNASKAVLAVPCGHVLCKSCVAKFMTPSGQRDPHAPEADHEAVRCYVCEADLSGKGAPREKEGKQGKQKIRPGLVELRSEGTGFSAGGANEVKKQGVAFQC
ncbi:hypothetical protein P8C59_003052 [Phyllachora maydis]|uniref:RING-type domain-containing protein n=1 Tax=Phyllachora maydis TaxID=1825666 RepID=A0AAD9MB16_9PEZI|nr:hypothetical protein P8C59_003052 [Phyllachora maydis]